MNKWFVTVTLEQTIELEASSREIAEQIALQAFDVTSFESEPTVTESWSDEIDE